MIKTKTLRRLFVIVVVLLSTALLYRYSPYKIEFLGHYDKIFAHRVNSKEKLKSSIIFFSGIELDLVYLSSKGVFDVNHPPAKSISLQLDHYMSDIKDNIKPFLWLDIKNLNQNNAEKILERLLYIFDKYDFPHSRILIETQQPEALPLFDGAGFLTSYYLPFGLTHKNPTELKNEVDVIMDILNEQPYLAISSSYIDYEILNAYFPDRSKYLWMIDGLLSHGITKPSQILKDEKVKALVVRFKAIKGNR